MAWAAFAPTGREVHTFRMLCGLSRLTEGECFVAGMNLALPAGGAASAKLGYMA